MKYQVLHITDYIYEFPAVLCHNLMFQIPQDQPFQKVEGYLCDITPKPSYEVERIDFFGNKYLYFSVERSHRKLTVTSQSMLDLSTPGWFNVHPGTTMPWEEVVTLLHSHKTTSDIRQYYLESQHTGFIDGIREYALGSFSPGRPILAAALDLNARIFRDFAFTPGFTDISTPLQKVFEHKKGVCQDFAHFFSSLCANIGIGSAIRKWVY